MTGCQTCGGYGDKHDPVAHGAEPDEYDQLWEADLDDIPAAVCCYHKRFVPCRDDDEDCDISTHPADVEHVRAYQITDNTEETA